MTATMTTLLILILVGFPAFQAQTRPDPGSAAVAASTVVASHASLFDALCAIRQSNTEKVLFGFEDDGSVTKGSIEVEAGNLKALISQLQNTYLSYQFEIAEQGIVHVRPSAAYSGSSILEVRVSHFEIRGHRTIADVIQHLAFEVPELRSAVYPKAPGTIGAVTSGGMEPELAFSADNVTVRELLDRLSLYSVEIFKRNGQPQPISWHFTFRADPRSGNTFQGYPEFSVF